MNRLSSLRRSGSIRNHASAFLFSFLLSVYPLAFVHGQMVSVVNSLADDEHAHPWDNPLTLDIDESIDGVCGDENGRCTLRAALEEASYLDVPAHVTFSAFGLLIMDPMEGWFEATDGSIINGGGFVSITGNGASTPVIFAVNENTKIFGIEFYDALIGLVIGGSDNYIGKDTMDGANYFYSMTQNGIVVGGDRNVLTNNFVGFDNHGNPGPCPFGISVFGNENIIGTASVGNTICYNDRGISVSTADSISNNFIVGNFIGTDEANSSGKGNKVGVEVIRGNVMVEDNVISGNTESAVLLGVQAMDVDIKGNYIGVDNTGNIMIPNRDGIVLGPGSQSCVVENNLIKGNSQFGIFASGLLDSALESSYHSIIGNDILVNMQAGIAISNNTHDVLIGQDANFGTPNNIQFNGHGGVVFSQSFGTPEYNTIRKNSFRNNNTKGIDIYPLCATCQKHIFPPFITGYMEADPASAVVTGTHETVGSIIDVYTGDINSSGRYEGRVWLGSATVNADHDFIVVLDNCQCDIVATASDPQGNTSEFTDGKPITTSVHDQQGGSDVVNVYPNPFSQTVTLEFQLLEPSAVTLRIYDTSGRIVKTLVDETLQTGMHDIQWDAEDAAPGMYYYECVGLSRVETTGKLFRTR